MRVTGCSIRILLTRITPHIRMRCPRNLRVLGYMFQSIRPRRRKKIDGQRRLPPRFNQRHPHRRRNRISTTKPPTPTPQPIPNAPSVPTHNPPAAPAHPRALGSHPPPKEAVLEIVYPAASETMPNPWISRAGIVRVIAIRG